ncbi:MAG TPA: serine hydrolase domain-containing protein [Polyangiaceae bacterium]|nr:serine hydrolase domain-containing protein [Polyangiaceae bacterium]
MVESLAELASRFVVRAGVAPAAAVAIAFKKRGVWQLESGAAGTRSVSSSEPVTADSPFDLASITKPFVAAALVRSSQHGQLALDRPLGELLPSLRGSHAAACSIEQLLAHRSGLAAHRALYVPLLAGEAFDRKRALWEAAQAIRPECRAPASSGEFPPVYSDLGYILAGAAAEHALAAPLEALLRAQVGEPLGLRAGPARQWLQDDPQFLERVVPTDIVAWRGGELSGVVHDDNAWALSGHALSGHAGLFGTAACVARFGSAMLDALAGRAGSWLDRASAEFLCRPRAGGSLRAGFDGKAALGSTAGDSAGPRTFGHLGFTGTSFWCDPDRECVSVLLTNRVRLGDSREKIRDARPRVHDALFSWADARA